jgi:hypothetical protein
MRLNVDHDFQNFVKSRLLDRPLVEGDQAFVVILGSAIPFIIKTATPQGIVQVASSTHLCVYSEPDSSTRNLKQRRRRRLARYWLTFDDPSLDADVRCQSIDSIAFDHDELWCIFTFAVWSRNQGVGWTRVTDTEPTGTYYPLGWRFQHFSQQDLANERFDALVQDNWTYIRGITVKNGRVWYGERRGRYQASTDHVHPLRPDRQITTDDALCHIDLHTQVLTKYPFPLLNPDALDYLSRKTRKYMVNDLQFDASGRRIWGATYFNHGWVFDTNSNQLKSFCFGGFQGGRPKHWLHHVVVEPEGGEGWFVDSQEALAS